MSSIFDVLFEIISIPMERWDKISKRSKIFIIMVVIIVIISGGLYLVSK